MGTGMKVSFITALTDVDSTDKEGVGSHRYEDGSVYKYVQIKNTTATVAGAAGDPVAYAAATGYSSNLVVIDLSDADANFALPAGVLMGTVTGTAGTSYYGWVKIKGAATLNTALGGTAADGDALSLAATDKTVTKRANADDNLFGYAMDASAKTVVVDCPW